MNNIDQIISSMVFFEPDKKMISWLKKYANGRVVIDVGCGGANFLERYVDAGGKAMGIEPFLHIDLFSFNRKRIEKNKEIIHILPKMIQSCQELLDGIGEKALLLFARPCHSNFVEDALKMKPKEMEALYITVPKNLDKYDDLGKYKSKAIKINHIGTSTDREVVYSIK